MDLVTNYGFKCVVGFLLGATGAFLVNISLKAMRIIALAQGAFLGLLAISGVITINFGRLLEILTDIVNWFADSLGSIFSSLLELGTFGAGFAGVFIGTTVLLETLNDER